MVSYAIQPGKKKKTKMKRYIQAHLLMGWGRKVSYLKDGTLALVEMVFAFVWMIHLKRAFLCIYSVLYFELSFSFHHIGHTLTEAHYF